MNLKNRETRRVTIDVDVDLLNQLDELKVTGNFGSRGKALQQVLPEALNQLDEKLQDRDPTPLKETESTEYKTDLQRIADPLDTEPTEYAGHNIGENVTLFFTPKRGTITRIWKTRKGYRFIVIFTSGGYAVLKPADMERAINAAKEAHRVITRNAQIREARAA